MRDRLIGLLDKVQECGMDRPKDEERYPALYPSNEQVADHLLANGVIVPKVGIGATIYAVPLYPSGVYEFEVADISVGLINGIYLFTFLCYGGWVFDDTHWGKTVFLTREEAEAALAERMGERDNT